MPDRKDLIVIASAKAKPGSGEELERALREVAKPTGAQTGCVRFSLYRWLEAPSLIVGLGRWASREDHQRHLQGSHVQKLMSVIADSLAEPPHFSSYEIVDED